MDFGGDALAMSQTGIETALAKIGAAPAALWAVLSTETSGCGFLADGRPKILFERHVFHHLTHGRFDGLDPDVSAATPGGYGHGGANQYLRLHAAILLDEDAALQSASWGLGQVMGYNFEAAGFTTVRAMVTAFGGGEDVQLAAMASFISARAMAAALAAKNWAGFARLYNGPNYAQNDYDGKLQHFCGIYEAQGVPDVMLRAVQMYLTFLGYTVGGIDGIRGTVTDAAIASFCADHQPYAKPVINSALIDLLRNALKKRRAGR